MISKKDSAKNNHPWFLIIGFLLLTLGLIIPVTTYIPVVKSEIKYQYNLVAKTTPAQLIPVNQDFSLIIPKINANSPVIKNVDPYDPAQYQPALTRGVAHAVTSGLPNEPGNTFIFAHSAGNWYQANQFNAVFYLLNKLVIGDEIIIYYQNQDYHYFVSDTKMVTGSEVNYLKNNSANQQLTLMTCWPPGTTIKRLLVVANLSTNSR